MHALSAQVETLIRDVAEQIVLPRYQQLEAHEIVEKTPGELVTIADRESEAMLNEGLCAILPEARLVGEEACAADPSLMDGLGSGLAWLIDPIDGTANFASGKPPFGIMVALVSDGDSIASWMYDPLRQRMCHAATGQGAFVDGERTLARSSGADIPVAGISTHFMKSEDRAGFMARATGHMTLADIPRCAAEQYPRIVLGVNDLALFERVLPWDHAPGALFLTEAGGKIARLDGSPYRVGEARKGLLGAASPDIWDKAIRILAP